MEIYYQNAIQFLNRFILKLQYICCNVHFLDVVKLQYICSNFTTLYFKDTFSCIVKLHCVLVINFHYIYCKIKIEIFNSVYFEFLHYITIFYSRWFFCLLAEVFIIKKIFDHYTVGSVRKFKKIVCYRGNVKFDDIFDVFE